VKINITLNGKPKRLDTEAGERVIDLLRRNGILSVKNGCDGEGTCGMCAILLNGKSVNSCQLLSPQIDGCDVRTSESLAKNNELHVIQQAFLDTGIVQCGYCTPSMLMATLELLERNPEPSEDDIKNRSLMQ
jgi:aerobic-type carbon monoxide dehydrogenase small subunit (CoxS/CutS family)